MFYAAVLPDLVVSCAHESVCENVAPQRPGPAFGGERAPPALFATPDQGGSVSPSAPNKERIAQG
eukprot:11087078-Lingulodinium_polyedra.AAC.1